MGSLSVQYSEIVRFANDCRGEYKTLLDYAGEACSNVKDCLKRVQWSLDKVNEQLSLARRLLEQINIKVSVYRSQMEEAKRQVEHCRERVNYILSHPVTRSYTDSNGESHTVSEIDEEALASARRELAYAETTYRHYYEKYAAVEAIRQEVIAWVNKLEILKKAIDSVYQSVQQDLYQTEKFANAIQSECGYNLQKLNDVIDCISDYLDSKPIYIPSLKSFSSGQARTSGRSNGSSGFVGSGGSTWQGLSVDKVKPGESISGAAENKKGVNAKDVPIAYSKASHAKKVSERYFFKQSRRDESTLSEDEKYHLKIYLNTNAYNQINGYLCNHDWIEKELPKTIEVMTDAISKYKLKRNTVLYKGIKKDKVREIFGDISGMSEAELNAKFCNRLYANKGFFSTSIKEVDAKGFYEKKGGAVFIINAPCGAEGIYTGSISAHVNDEHEVLLQRGSVFEINRITKESDYLIINLTLAWRQKIDERN